MIRALACLAVLLLAGVVSADEALKSQTPLTQLADDTSRGGPQGHSQQYHYNSYPSDGYTSAGLSFDLSTGIFLAIGAIVLLLALAAVCYPLLSGSKSGGQGWGWDAGSSAGAGGYGGGSSGWSRSYNFAGTAEKVLNAVEKLYDAYGKTQ